MKINLVFGGVSKNSCEIGSRSIGSLDEILNLWIISAVNVKYSISASRFPTQFRFPTENGQILGFFLANLNNWVHIYSLLSLDLKLLKSFRLKYSRFRKIFRIVHHSQKRCYNAISFLDDVPIDFSILNAYMRNRVGYWSKSKIFMQNSIEEWTFFDDKLSIFWKTLV